MYEYEYSFRVTSVEPYHAFCESRHVKEVTITNMRRRIFEDGSNFIFRITERISNGTLTVALDMKEKKSKHQRGTAKSVKETPAITVKNSDVDLLEDTIQVLGFTCVTELKKTRTSYHFGKAHVDIDHYTFPTEAYVVEIEGQKTTADKLFFQISEFVSAQK